MISTHTTEITSSREDVEGGRVVHTAEGRYGVYLVELTPDGYRIRHGRYSGYGRGVWHSRSRACRAADHLADGEIPAALLADRVSTDALEADLRESRLL